MEKKRVLIVDDEITMRTLLEHFLNQRYDVMVMENGKAAFTWLKEKGKIDFLVIDLSMPEMDGFALIQEVRRDPGLKHLPLIVLSSKESSADKIRCLKLGADDYITKPFNPEELEARMESILRRIN